MFWEIVAILILLILLVDFLKNGGNLVVEIPPKSSEKLEEVCRNAGIPDKVEVVRQAVAVYAKLMEYEVMGAETCIRLPNGEIIPIITSMIKVKK